MTETSGRKQQADKMAISEDLISHHGELEMRARFPSSYHWNEHNLSLMMAPTIPISLARFIEAQPFFFIATASNTGHCDASFRGRDYDASGKALPALRVIDERHLVFPDFSGNGLYNSLGNIVTNPHIGMLFVDFERQRRARVNGHAEIRIADDEIHSVWPQAQAAIFVTVQQAYGNCKARIPRLTIVPQSDDDWT